MRSTCPVSSDSCYKFLFTPTWGSMVREKSVIGQIWDSAQTLCRMGSVVVSCGYDTYPSELDLFSAVLYSEIDHTYLSIEAQCVSHHYPRWTATGSVEVKLTESKLSIRNHWLDKASSWSWCCKREDLDWVIHAECLHDSLLVRYPATHTVKGKKLSGSVFYWVIKKSLRLHSPQVFDTGKDVCLT